VKIGMPGGLALVLTVLSLTRLGRNVVLQKVQLKLTSC